VTPTAPTLALLQQSAGPDPADNHLRTLTAAEAAASEGAQIICTQELFATQYFCQSEEHDNFALAEPIPGPTTEAFQSIARKHEAVIITSIFEKRAPGLFHNSAAVIDADGKLLGIYRKMHIPDDPLYHEKFYFTPGDKGFRAWNTRHGSIGVLICWDQWYPEAARLTALAGAELLLIPTAIGWHPAEKQAEGEEQLKAWQTIQQSHAIANGCFVAATNRTGHENPAGGDGLEFWGHSFVAAPNGEIIAQAKDQQTSLMATIDFSKVNETRTHWPFLRDRRIDAYDGLTERFID
tara:strand:- start:228 stop:1109 length:882 start_codon:yes stop_codon:yes gene_type:complete